MVAGHQSQVLKQALVVGGQANFVMDKLSKSLKRHGIGVHTHLSWKKRRPPAALPKGIDLVYICTDMVGHGLSAPCMNYARELGIPYVNGTRKWAESIERLTAAGFPLIDPKEVLPEIIEEVIASRPPGTPPTDADLRGIAIALVGDVARAEQYFEPVYNGFTELWVRWEFDPALQLTVGQQKHRFTHDRNVSSRYMSFMERSMFTNMMGLDYTPAVTLSGRVGKCDYYAGVFSNLAERDMWEAFTELHSGWSAIAAVTYDLGNLGGADSAAFYGSLLHSEARTSATNLTRFDDAASAALILTEGPAALVTEVTAGFGGTRGDAIGLNLQPSLFLTDKLELVSRYQLASASMTGGLRSQRRYEAAAGLPNGEHYQATYLGLNYYLAGHRMKLLTGVEHARMNNRDSFTVFAGFRMYFGPHSNAPYPGNKLLKGIW